VLAVHLEQDLALATPIGATNESGWGFWKTKASPGIDAAPLVATVRPWTDADSVSTWLNNSADVAVGASKRARSQRVQGAPDGGAQQGRAVGGSGAGLQAGSAMAPTAESQLTQAKVEQLLAQVLQQVTGPDAKGVTVSASGVSTTPAQPGAKGAPPEK
jgi:hypothetical protein